MHFSLATRPSCILSYAIQISLCQFRCNFHKPILPRELAWHFAHMNSLNELISKIDLEVP